MLLVVVLSMIIRLFPHARLSAVAPSSTAVLAADGSLLRLTLASDEQYRLWIPLKDMSPTLVDAVKLQEDQWFYWHFGINPLSLFRGAWQTYTGQSRQGGSTLTMQLARLIYQLNTRSATGKFKQAALALWLEVRYSKHDILEAYLNLAPYGRNIQGVGAASLIYFGKAADKLTLQEALTLAVIPQRPNNRINNKKSNSLQSAKMRLFARWQAKYKVSAGEAHLVSLPLPLKALSALPFTAPHFVERVLSDLPTNSVSNSQIKTSLEPRLQALLERQVKQYVTQNRARGIKNAVAMLIDTRTQSVVALQGSADFFNAGIDGQVNGALGKRSPGSTLKPFIYGMAMDQGIIHPHSILKDAPTAFGPFQPENFDGRFVGPVTATDALIRSRNIPAVYLAAKLNKPSLYDFLKNAGISKLQAESHYGLAIVLGGGEVTMEELATLYTMLANGGELKPLNYLADSHIETGLRLLSEEASFLTLDMLAKNPRPDGIPAANGRRWATMWKTGTSWGFRDAWTVGVTGPYVLAIWIGNFDGSSNPAIVGLEAAAPLFFRIADALPLTLANEPETVRIPPRNLSRVSVCAASGDLPNKWCPQLADTWFIPGKSPIKVSTLHRPVVINNQTGLPACPPYDGMNTHTEIFEFWDSSMMRLFREAGMPRRVPPSAHCGDNGAIVGDAPRITSPLLSVAYTLRLSRPNETIALQATAGGDTEKLYWFSDKDYLGNVASKSGGKAWRPANAGWHNLTVVDDKGRSASRDVKIEIVP